MPHSRTDQWKNRWTHHLSLKVALRGYFTIIMYHGDHGGKKSKMRTSEGPGRSVYLEGIPSYRTDPGKEANRIRELQLGM
jgi:hypothetical protein